MKFKRWIPLGSLILLMCAQQGDATLILGSMLMAATAAMTGGLIMGPLTIGGLIMMMMMAANQQAGNQRQAGSANLATTLESSQNLLNLLSSLTGAASNLATSASTQSSTQKASKRHLYTPQNLDELLAISSRNTAANRQWKSIPQPTAQPRSTTTYYGSNDDFWNPKATFSPNGFAVEPIPDDLLDIAMRFPRPTERSYSHLFDESTPTPTTSTSTSHTTTTSGPPFDTSDVIRRMMDLASPQPFTSTENMRWVASEPGDLFSSFPEVREEDFLSLVKKRATREVLSSKFRLEDIANVTYANFQDPAVKQQLSERERQDVVNTRIFRQLSALDPLRCLPQLACNLQATPPSQKSGIMNDYAYLLKTVFERDDIDEDDEEEDKEPSASTTTTTKGVSSIKGTKGTSSSSTKNKGVAGSIASDIATLIKAASSSSSGKKKLNYHSPGKTNKGKKEGAGDDKEENDDGEDEEFSSEEIPMNDEELDRLMLKEQYEMERLANEQLLNDDPNMLPFVLKSASKAPPYLGPDKRYDGTIGLAQEIAAEEAMMAQGGGRRSGGSEYPPTYFRDMSRSGVGEEEYAEEAYAQPAPLFTVANLNRLRQEDLDRMSSGELNQLLKQVSYPEGQLRYDAEPGDDSIGAVLANYMPKLPEISIGFTRRRTTGNTAFDDDPFFDDFEMRKRSLGPGPKNVRVVRKAKAEGQIARRMTYLRSMRKKIAAENDSAKIFKMATTAGAKIKSARQCRFLFNTCPMNSTQLMGMIGNIRNAVLNLSNPQQLINGLQTTTASPAKDVVGTLATIGPNVVKFQPSDIPASAPAPTQAPVPPQINQQPVMQMQMHTPSMQMMPSNTHSHSQSSQNTLVVPQIIQVPMPIHTQSPNPAPQQVIIHSPQSHPQYQQQMPQYQQYQMPQQQQQQMPQYQQQMPQMMGPAQSSSQGNYNRHPIYNIATSVGSGSDSDSGPVSISSELPSGEKFEISVQRPGNDQQQQIATPSKYNKKPLLLGSSRPSIPASSAPTTLNSMQRNKDTAAALVDLFDDDNSDNYLLPTKALIETEIKEPPTTALDSLQAAILAIEKINEAADRAKVKHQDDEKEDFKINQKLEASLKRPIKAVPLPKKSVPAGLRLPNKKNKDKPEDDGEEDDSSEEEEDEDEEDENPYRTLPDPMNPKSREFITVPTKTAQFGSTLTVPSTQTFVKKTLLVEPNSNRRMGYNSASSEENNYRNLGNRGRFATDNSGSSEEYQSTMQYNRRKIRRPRILYPQESMEKPLFIPL